MGASCSKNNNAYLSIPLKQVRHIPYSSHTPAERTDNENKKKPSRITTFPHPQTKMFGLKKENIFLAKDYQYVDDHVLKAPESLLMEPYAKVLSYLLSDASWNDVAKVRAIFLWLTSFDINNLKVKGQPASDASIQYMAKIKNDFGNYANLFYGMCQMAYITCDIINGISKNCNYEIGQHVDVDKMACQWNAVYIGESWRFVDVLWASCCISDRQSERWNLVESDLQEKLNEVEGQKAKKYEHHFNEFYFLPNPDELIYTHFPDEEEWQLLETPVTLEQFEDHFYLRDTFYRLGLKPTAESPTSAVLQTVDGQTCIWFELTKKDSDQIIFKHMIYAMTENDSTSKIDKFLDRFVFFEQQPNMIYYSLRFPMAGTFRMEIYGLDVRETDAFELACSYLIHCPSANLVNMPFPDYPKIGWGPGAAIKKVGLIPVHHKDAFISTSDGKVELRFVIKPVVDIELYPVLKHAAIDQATLTKYVCTWKESDEVIVSVRLPGFGEYALKLYAHNSNDVGEAPNVCNYLVQFDGILTDGKKFPNISMGIIGKHHLAQLFCVTVLSNAHGMVTANDGHFSVHCSVPEHINLLCELHTSDLSAQKTMTVVTKHHDDRWSFNLDLPNPGEYSLNIFAQTNDDPYRIHSVYVCLLTSTGEPNFKEDNTTSQRPQYNLLQSETVETSENDFLMPLRSSIMKPKVELYRRNSNNLPNRKEIEIITKIDNSKNIHLHLGYYACYILNLFDTDSNGNLTNIVRYHINRKPPEDVYCYQLDDIVDTVQKHGLDPALSPSKNILPSRVPSMTSRVPSMINIGPSSRVPSMTSIVPSSIAPSSIASSSIAPSSIAPSSRAPSSREQPSTSPSSRVQSSRAPSSGAPSSREQSSISPSSRVQSSRVQSSRAPSNNLLDSEVPASHANKPPSKLPAVQMPVIKITKQAEPDTIGGKDQTINETMHLIEHALSLQHEQLLEEATKTYLKTNPSKDDPLLKKSNETLILFKTKTALQAACQTRTVSALDNALKEAHIVNKENQLDMSIALAVKLRDHLKTLPPVTQELLHLSVNDLKQYSHPPKQVHEVMKATFILLGSRLSEVKNWNNIITMLRQDGKDSLNMKLTVFDPKMIRLSRVKAVKKKLKRVSMENVDLSYVLFYDWVTTMVKEVEVFVNARKKQKRKKKSHHVAEADH